MTRPCSNKYYLNWPYSFLLPLEDFVLFPNFKKKKNDVYLPVNVQRWPADSGWEAWQRDLLRDRGRPRGDRCHGNQRAPMERRFRANASRWLPLSRATGSGRGGLNADDVSCCRHGKVRGGGACWSVHRCSNQSAHLLPWLPESPMVQHWICRLQHFENKDEMPVAAAAAAAGWNPSDSF